MVLPLIGPNTQILDVISQVPFLLIPAVFTPKRFLAKTDRYHFDAFLANNLLHCLHKLFYQLNFIMHMKCEWSIFTTYTST